MKKPIHRGFSRKGIVTNISRSRAGLQRKVDDLVTVEFEDGEGYEFTIPNGIFRRYDQVVISIEQRQAQDDGLYEDSRK